MKAAMAVLLTTGCLMAAFVSAKEKYHDVVNAQSEDAFTQIADNVRREMAAGGKYEFVKPDERATIDKNLGEMTTLFRERGTVDKMSEPQKVELFNSQEVVNSILTKRDSDRVICENRMPIGSHIPKTTCHTYGQQEEARRGTNQAMDKLRQSACISISRTDKHCGGT